eukprot:scaffold659_cov192-Ochromonas_danica.AAC.23
MYPHHQYQSTQARHIQSSKAIRVEEYHYRASWKENRIFPKESTNERNQKVCAGRKLISITLANQTFSDAD